MLKTQALTLEADLVFELAEVQKGGWGGWGLGEANLNCQINKSFPGWLGVNELCYPMAAVTQPSPPPPPLRAPFMKSLGSCLDWDWVCVRIFQDIENNRNKEKCSDTSSGLCVLREACRASGAAGLSLKPSKPTGQFSERLACLGGSKAN